MRVLITRTADDCIATSRALEALGHEAIIAPLRERLTLNTPLPDGPFDAVLATSRHAFWSAFSCLPAALKALPCYGVGEKTREAALAAGFLHAQTCGSEGAALATALLGRFKPGASLLYLAGRPRHDALEKTLETGGMKPVICERYAMKRVESLPEAARLALAEGTLDAVLHYSSESARAFLDLAAGAGLGAQALAPLQLCLSPAVASVFQAPATLRQTHAILRQTPARLRIASQPNEAALLERLRS